LMCLTHLQGSFQHQLVRTMQAYSITTGSNIAALNRSAAVVRGVRYHPRPAHD
jgi:hypothetical protein